MKKQLNEVKKLQKIAGILKENMEAEQLAGEIYDDISMEYDASELASMSEEDAISTVEAYGHSGPMAREIAMALISIAQDYGN